VTINLHDFEKPTDRAFLDVEHSLLGRRWEARISEAGSREALAMTQAYGLPDILSRVLAGRGVRSQEAQGYLAPKLRDLMPDPTVLQDMDKAATRLAEAALQAERVAIFGDYDVDGACSAAALALFLRGQGANARIHIPDRLIEGYGPNVDAIRTLRDEGASLLVCVDCGTASHEPLAEARRLGMDVVVLDHHQAPEVLPEVTALVNPNRQDDLSGLGHLCAAGVVFMTLVAANRILRQAGRENADLLGMLDLVALATVADVVPIQGLNRAFVAQGLKVMRSRGRPGLAALFDLVRLDRPPEAWHLGFLIGPRINAGGRIGDAALGARLLTTEDSAEARAIAERLDTLNRDRQAVEQAMLAEAEAQALAAVGMEEEASPVIVTADPRWHPGVVGLVAARLKERFRRPAFAIAIGENGQAVGSGRSVAGVDLGRAVREAVDAGLLIKGGGHRMAAGITLDPTKISDFNAFLDQRLGEAVLAARAGDTLKIDAAMTPASATTSLMERIAAAGPFGQGNPEPIFAFPAVRLTDLKEVGQGHLKLRLLGSDGARLSAVAFRSAESPLGIALQKLRGQVLHVCGSLAVDHWGGRESVELRLQDAAVPARPG
jgi:single-stranded-DNA-specific exonuclease